MASGLTVPAHGRRVRQEEVVSCSRRLEGTAMPWGQGAVQVAAIHHHPGLVECGPVPNPAVQRPKDDFCIVSEPPRGVGIQPASQVVERRWQVPVEQGGERLDSVLQQFIHQTAGTRPLAFTVPRTVRQDPAPGDAEPVGGEAEFTHQPDVALPPLVVLTSRVTGVSTPHHSLRVAEPVPVGDPCPVRQGKPSTW